MYFYFENVFKESREFHADFDFDICGYTELFCMYGPGGSSIFSVQGIYIIHHIFWYYNVEGMDPKMVVLRNSSLVYYMKV